MSDHLQTRTEHSRSLEDAERFKAIETLKEIGLLTPVSDFETYHGRVKIPGETETWTVNPHFKNGGDDSGNDNVNSRPTLYTADKTIADSFADKRSRGGLLGANEAHKIISDNTDATVIETEYSFYENMSEEDRQRMLESLKKLTLSYTRGAPIEFSDRDTVDAYIKALDGASPTEINVEDISLKSGMSITSVRRMLGAWQAKHLLTTQPFWAAVQVLKSNEDTINIPGNDNHPEYPLSIEYLQRFFKEAHIIGAKQKVWSATLGKHIQAVGYFDLDQVKTVEQNESNRNTTQRTLGAIATEFSHESSETVKNDAHPIWTQLNNPYAKPSKLVRASSEVRGFKDLFTMPTGVWEGYTLAEHTETVLNNFDENYADQLPVDMLPLMRLAIIGHDLGKPVAVANGTKEYQHEYNQRYAKQFYENIGVSSKTNDLLLAIIGQGAELIHDIDVDKNRTKISELSELAGRSMTEYLETETPSLDQLKGFVKMCRILQICDGGAYSSMAVTRSKERKAFFRNAGTFDQSFKPPVGPGKRDIRPL